MSDSGEHEEGSAAEGEGVQEELVVVESDNPLRNSSSSNRAGPSRTSLLPHVTIPISSLPPNAPSIHISFMHPHTRESTIARALEQSWGIPSHITIIDRRGAGAVGEDGRPRGALIRRRDGTSVPPSRAVIHMASWHRHREAQKARRDLLEGMWVKLYVDSSSDANGYYFGCTLYKFK